MSKYLDEAGVKELLKLIRKYVDLKTNNIPANFDSYIENNGFTLTDEQLQKAYLEYKNNKRK